MNNPADDKARSYLADTQGLAVLDDGTPVLAPEPDMERHAALGTALGRALDECSSCCLDDQEDRERVLKAIVLAVKPFVTGAS
jgi:hypothetical protein